MILRARKLRRSYGEDDSVSRQSITDERGNRIPSVQTTQTMINQLSMALWHEKSRCIQSVWRSYWTRRLIFQLHYRRALYALRALRMDPLLRRALCQQITQYARYSCWS